MSAARKPQIHVLAGVNGAGKSSIGGAAIRHRGGEYFNPDEAARFLLKTYPTLTQVAANSAAWSQGVRLLARAIDEELDYSFESTLGGNTITNLLIRAATQSHEIHIWYVGLSSPELHVERVRSRVTRGGHAIPETDIRRRYEHSRLNLIALLPFLTTLHMYDNSVDADPAAGRTPQLAPVLQVRLGKIIGPMDLSSTPNWARPIVAAALKLGRR